MRQLVLLLAVGYVLTQTVSSRAAPLDYDSLPKGRVDTMPELADAPKSVLPGKASPGFWLTKQPQPGGSVVKGTFEFLQLSGSKLDFDRLQTSGTLPAAEDTFQFTSCFQAVPVNSLPSAKGLWTGGGEPSASMVLQKQDAPDQHVYAGHVERWVESAEGVALETSDAWIDLATRGVRVYQNSRLPLVKVAEPYVGVAVYAGRTERSVEFVVRSRPADNKHGGRLASQVGQGLVFTIDNQSSGSSCGFVRIGLDGEPGEGQAANVIMEVAVAVDQGDPSNGAHNEPTNPTPREVTLRTLSMSLSVSRLSPDLQPVPTVSYGFVGDQRRVPF